ncbi:MAG: MipA/OmpV family protein [Bacteriovoracaceae bacterium]|nr:MipA/OmpV family protein [Bacteriovoracaceae bacterium]
MSANDGSSHQPKRKRSLFEMGLGGLIADYPDYPGADHNKRIAIPFPSATYRGKHFRAQKDEGVRGIFLKSDYFELDLSIDGTFASEAKDNKARSEMPNLDAVIEFGPKLLIHLKKRSTKNRLEISLHFPLRYAISISSNLSRFNDRGITINPFVSLKYEGFFFKEEALFLSTLGIKFASKKLMDYYYAVDRNYAIPSRPFYHAKSGYLETSLAAALFYPLKYSIWLFGGTICAFHHNSANAKSPLLVKKTTITLVLGLYWNFYKSN